MEAGRDIAAGRYRLVDRLGAGGMAEVWRAWDARLHVWRAIKVLHTASNASLVARFDAEARTMARLRHPHLLAVHDVGWEGERPFLVMDLLPGGSLDDHRRRLGRLPPRAAARLVADVLDGLAVAHAAGVVHRDVKPHNVLVDASGSAVLGDFGIARIADDRSNPTRTGMALGTLAYMAPEQRTHARSVDGRADLYAAGATLVALLTGSDPYDLHVEAALAEQLRDVPAPLAEVITRATRWEPDDRYPDAPGMAAALRAAADALPDEPPLDLSSQEGDRSPPPETAATYATYGGTGSATWGGEPPESPPPPAPEPPPAPRTRSVGPALLLPAGIAAAVALWTFLPSDPAALEPVDLSGFPRGATLASDGATLLGVVEGALVERSLSGGASRSWAAEVAIEEIERAPGTGSALAKLADGSFARVTRDGAVERLAVDAAAVWPEPGGERLVLQRPEGLFVSEPGGVRRIAVAEPDERIVDIAWSPDGHELLLAVSDMTARGREARVDRIEVAGGKRLGSTALPDGVQTTSVAFVAADRAWVGGTDTRGKGHIWSVQLEAGGFGAASTVEVFEDANEVRLEGVAGGRALIVASRWERDVWVLDAEGAAPAAATEGLNELTGDFFGDELLYTSVVHREGRLLPSVRTTGSPDPFPGGEGACWPAAAGDGLVWWRFSEKTCDLERWRPGEAPASLFSVAVEAGPTPCGFVTCARDGRVCVTSDGASMLRFDPVTGERAPMAARGVANGTAFDLDPDGGRLAILRDGRVELHPLDGGAPTSWEVPRAVDAKQLAWTAAGDALWIAGTCEDSRDCIGRLDGAAGFERRFTAPAGDFVGLHLAAHDDDRVAFTYGRRVRQGWLASP